MARVSQGQATDQERPLLPFPKRQPAQYEYDLRTGDYEAHQPHAAPRQRGFQHAAQEPAHPAHPAHRQEFTPYATVQVAPHVHNDMRMMGHTPPPHSLAPVAMSQVSSTASYKAQDTVVLRGRPDLRWGVTLALVGALCGGLLGVAMHAGKADRAKASAAAHDEDARLVAAPQAVVAPAVVAPQAVVAPAVVAPQAVVAPAVAAPVVIAPAPPQPPAPPPNALAVRAAPQPKVAAPPRAPRGSSHVATTHKSSRAPRAPAASAPPAPSKASTVQLASKVQPPPPPDKGGVGDAVRLLRDATKESDNTLGGSR
jgi:hypothetical protein